MADLIKENKLDLSYAIVSEAGASVYSAGDIARKEFPDLHVEEEVRYLSVEDYLIRWLN